MSWDTLRTPEPPGLPQEPLAKVSSSALRARLGRLLGWMPQALYTAGISIFGSETLGRSSSRYFPFALPFFRGPPVPGCL